MVRNNSYKWSVLIDIDSWKVHIGIDTAKLSAHKVLMTIKWPYLPHHYAINRSVVNVHKM